MICQLKTILVLLDLSQQDLAAALGVSRNTVSDWARNKTSPTVEIAYKLLDIINGRAFELGLLERWAIENVWIRNINID